MDSNAKLYSKLSRPQYEHGCDFIRSLNLSKGDKVLDMGCGTGEVTKVIADAVGDDGEVVAVDPDEARIEVAREKFRGVQNMKFFVGNSVTGFPYDNEPYFDVHFSTGVFAYVLGDEKKTYIKKAYDCLKPGGRIAIRCGNCSELRTTRVLREFLSEGECKKLFGDVGLFGDVHVVVEREQRTFTFDSINELNAWFNASFHQDMKDMGNRQLERFLAKHTKKEDDGKVTLRLEELLTITARK